MKNDIAFDIDEVMVKFTDPVFKIIRNKGYKFLNHDSHDITKTTDPEISKNELHKIFHTVYKKRTNWLFIPYFS